MLTLIVMSSTSDGPPVTATDRDFVDLRSERLRLRRFAAEDLDAFVAYRTDPEVARYQGWGMDFDRAAGQRFLELVLAADPGEPGEWFQFAIERLDQPGLVGDCAALFGADEVEIGFTLARVHQGHGYATEAAGRLLGYLHGRGSRRAVGWCDVRNSSSAAVLLRLGFEHEERVDGEDRYGLRLG